MLPQWHVKDPGHSAKSAGDKLYLNTHTPLTLQSCSGLTGGRLYLNTHTPFTQQSCSGLTILSMHRVGLLRKTSLTRNLSGNTWPQSSQLAESLWTDPGLRVELVSVSWFPLWRQKRSAEGKWIIQPSPQILASEEKNHHHLAPVTLSVLSFSACWPFLLNFFQKILQYFSLRDRLFCMAPV